MDGAGSLIFFEREDKGVIERTQIWEVAFLTNQPFWELVMIHENFFFFSKSVSVVFKTNLDCMIPEELTL